MPLILNPRLLIVGLGVVIMPLDSSVNVAFPPITEHFAVPAASARLVVVSFILAMSSLLLVAGRLADLFGHRRMFRLGLALSAAALMADAFAPGFTWLLAARVVQGIGAALILGAGPALAIGLFRENLRGPVIGAYATIFAVGGAIGPLLGGWLIDTFDWRAVFWYRAPIALAVLGLTLFLPPPKAGTGERFDLTGAALLGAAVATLFIALNLAAAAPWIALPVGAVALAAGAAFVRQQWAHPAPIIRLQYFARPRFAGLMVAAVLVNLAAFSIMLIVPFHLAGPAGLGATAAGILLAAFPVGVAAGAWGAGAVIGRATAEERTARRLLRAGTLAVAAGLAWVASWEAATGGVAAGAALFLTGAGLGMFLPALMFIVTGTLAPEERGVAGSLAEITRTTGNVAAATLMFELFRVREAADGFHAAFGQTYLAAAGIAAAVLAVMLAASLIGGERRGTG